MRIRSTKPEFWKSERVASLSWDVHFDGPLPKGPRPYAGLAPVAANAEYVYLLFDAADRLLYVGRSWRPADRFTKHRRTQWWASVCGVVLLRVQSGSRRGAEADSADLEAFAISELSPLHNVAVGQRRRRYR